MKATQLIFSLLFGLLASKLNASGQPDLLLRAIVQLGDTQAFFVSNSSSTESAWLMGGLSFNGYTVESFDSESKVLTVIADGESFKLSLAPAAAEANEAGSKEERLAAATHVLDLMNFSKMMKDTMDSQVDAVFQGVRREMAQNGQLDEELIDLIYKERQEMFDEIDWAPIKDCMIGAYAEVFTKSELEGMSYFYATPAGQASIEKMPELQAIIMEDITPTMMKASQSTDQKLMKFMQERTQQQVAD